MNREEAGRAELERGNAGGSGESAVQGSSVAASCVEYTCKINVSGYGLLVCV